MRGAIFQTEFVFIRYGLLFFIVALTIGLFSAVAALAPTGGKFNKFVFLIGISVAFSGLGSIIFVFVLGPHRMPQEALVNGGEKFPRIVGQKFPTSF